MVEPCFYQLPVPSIKSIDGFEAKNFRLKLGATWGKTTKGGYRGELQMVQPYSSMSFQDTSFEGLVTQMLDRAKLLEKMVDGTNPEFVYDDKEPLYIQKQGYGGYYLKINHPDVVRWGIYHADKYGNPDYEGRFISAASLPTNVQDARVHGEGYVNVTTLKKGDRTWVGKDGNWVEILN